jgi:hypothetical protein
MSTRPRSLPPCLRPEFGVFERMELKVWSVVGTYW